MEFLAFCRLHDVLIDALPPLGVWRYYPTAKGHGNKRGSVKWCGDHGFVLNHQVMDQAAVWQPDEAAAATIDYSQLNAAIAREQARQQQGYARAAAGAALILGQCSVGRHPYLETKGFADGEGLVWQSPTGERVLVVPMRVGQRVVGLQKIFEEGSKRFMDGQTTRNAVFALGAGAPVWCEGYATGLSVRMALKAARLQRSVVVCFSAHTLKTTATAGFVVADNDVSKTGETAAQATGLPYWMSDVVGEDFNDFHRREGLFRASQALKVRLMRTRPEPVT